MKFVILLCLSCCFASVTFAQEVYTIWSLNPGDSRYIFADTAYVRVSTDTKQTPADTLFAGDDVTVATITEQSFTLKGITAPWVQIKYKKNGLEKEGFIWRGLLSFEPMRRGDTKFVYAMDRRVDTTVRENGETTVFHKFIIKLKVVSGGKLMGTVQWKIDDDEAANFTGGKVMSGLGLSNVQNIVVVNFGGQACGVPDNFFYYAWTNDARLVPLPGRMNVGDAGAYHHEENFVFPAEKNGKPDMIIMNMEEEESTDKTDKKGDTIFTSKKETAQYSWDGSTGAYKKAGK